MTDTPDLTEKQRHVVSLLPADKHEIGDELGIAPNTAKGKIEQLRSKGINVKWEQTGPAEGHYYLPDQAKVRRVSTKHTGTKTREANQWATEMEATILRRLKGKDPLIAPQAPTPGNEDMVVHLTDAHMGDVVEDERGREIFNPEICEASIEHFTEKVLDLKARMSGVASFDTCHLLWGGDMLTNENIYDGQAFDISLMLGDQMARVVDALVQQAKTFAEEFETLQLVSVVGNHGKTRASGVSKQANMDLLAYRWIEDRLVEAGYDNIHYMLGEAQHYRNFPVRDGRWRGHLRHGQNLLEHIDATAASARDWRGIVAKHDPDMAAVGHLHVAQRKDVLNYLPVFRSPSMKPGSEFAEKIGKPDCGVVRKLGTVWGSSDSRPVTWEFVVDAADMDAEQ